MNQKTRGDDYIDPSRKDVLDVVEGEGEVVDLSNKKANDDADKALAALDKVRVRGGDDPLPAQEDSDDDGGDPKIKLTKSMQKRINREKALRYRTEKSLTEVQRENLELRERMSKIERTQAESVTNIDITQKTSEIQAKIASVRADLEKVIESGDTKRQLELQIELVELVSDLKVAKARAEDRLAAAKATAEAAGKRSSSEDSDDDPSYTKAADWMKANRNWWNLSRFRDAKNDAVTIDKVISEEIEDGEHDFDKYSDEHFAELAKRLKEAYPDLDVRDPDGHRVEAIEVDLDNDDKDDRPDARGSRRTPEQRRPPGGGMGNRNGIGKPSERANAERGKVMLSAADYATMRRFGMDPNDEKSRKRFAAERRQTILNGARS